MVINIVHWEIFITIEENMIIGLLGWESSYESRKMSIIFIDCG
jgi:hypothetical protein